MCCRCLWAWSTPMLMLALLACGEDGAAGGAAGGGAGADTGAGAGAMASDAGADAAPDAGLRADAGAAIPGGSQDELAAFVAAELHRGPGWTAQTPQPRERSHDVSPHGRVRVWRNDTLLASQAAGHGVDLDAPKHDTGSMVVKEFYDDDGMQLGQAAMLKLEGDMRQWAYYCSGPDDRCMDTAPVYGVGFGVSCSFCHGGLVFTHAP